MRTSLQVESKTAEKLRQLAEARKVSIDELLATYVAGVASRDANQSGVEGQDRATAFEEWASGFASDTSPLSDEAISRASIYREP